MENSSTKNDISLTVKGLNYSYSDKNRIDKIKKNIHKSSL